MEINLKSIRNATGNKSTAVQGFFNTFFSEHLKSSEITIYADIRQGVPGQEKEESQKFLLYLVKNASGCQPLAFLDSVQFISISVWFLMVYTKISRSKNSHILIIIIRLCSYATDSHSCRFQIAQVYIQTWLWWPIGVVFLSKFFFYYFSVAASTGD